MKNRYSKIGLRTALLFFLGSGLILHGNLFSKTLPTKKATTNALSAAILSEEGLDLAGEAEVSEVMLDAEHASRRLENIISELSINPRRITPLPPTQLKTIDSETLWLARCIFSETKQPREQELIAWVVRNRVETKYRGKKTYRDVVLDPYQFSAFNIDNRQRHFYLNLTPESNITGWRTAITIAHSVRFADPQKFRPFPLKTRHFYSERSMVGRLHPEWADGLHPVSPVRNYPIDERRFRFYEGIW